MLLGRGEPFFLYGFVPWELLFGSLRFGSPVFGLTTGVEPGLRLWDVAVMYPIEGPRAGSCLEELGRRRSHIHSLGFWAYSGSCDAVHAEASDHDMSHFLT